MGRLRITETEGANSNDFKPIVATKLFLIVLKYCDLLCPGWHSSFAWLQLRRMVRSMIFQINLCWNRPLINQWFWTIFDRLDTLVSCRPFEFRLTILDSLDPVDRLRPFLTILRRLDHNGLNCREIVYTGSIKVQKQSKFVENSSKLSKGYISTQVVQTVSKQPKIVQIVKDLFNENFRKALFWRHHENKDILADFWSSWDVFGIHWPITPWERMQLQNLFWTNMTLPSPPHLFCKISWN